jgi:adenosylcobinamide-phosphate synthase
MGDGRAEATAYDIDLGLKLYRTACALLFGLAAGFALLAWFIVR